MNVLVTVSLLSPTLSQNLSVLNTLQKSYQNNYTLGFANNSCVRMSMFKLNSLSSGLASFLTLQFLPQLQPLTTNISLSLFSFSTNKQVGKTFTSSFNTNYLSITDISLANWNFTSGNLYYLTIQPTLTDYVKIPWGASAVSTTSVVLQQGSSCTTGQWAQFVTNDGEYIPVQILAQSLVTPNVIVSIGNTVTPNMTISSFRNSSDNITQTLKKTPSRNLTLKLIISPSSTSSPSNTPTTVSPPITPTNTKTSTPSHSLSQNLTVTPKQTPTLKFSFAGTTSPKSPDSSKLTESDSNSPSLTPTSQLLNSTGSSVPLFYQAQPVQSQQATPSEIAFSFISTIFALFSVTSIIMYIRHLYKKPHSPVAANPKSPSTRSGVHQQTLSPLILSMPPPNVWHNVNEGGETWYLNSETNESAWALPPGETLIE